MAMTVMGTIEIFAEVTEFVETAKEELCRTPAFISARVSPDGAWIAQVGADEAGIANLSIFPVGDDFSGGRGSVFLKLPESFSFFGLQIAKSYSY